MQPIRGCLHPFVIALSLWAGTTGRSLADLAGGMPRFPQTLINVRTAAPFDETEPHVAAAVRAVQDRFGDRGRIVLRPSGTEPVVRVMVEGEDAGEVAAAAEEIAGAVRSALGED